MSGIGTYEKLRKKFYFLDVFMSGRKNISSRRRLPLRPSFSMCLFHFAGNGTFRALQVESKQS